MTGAVKTLEPLFDEGAASCGDFSLLVWGEEDKEFFTQNSSVLWLAPEARKRWD